MRNIWFLILISGLFFFSCEGGFKEAPKYAITVLPAANGSVYVSRSNASEADTIVITVNPDAGKILQELTYNDSPLTGNNPYSFEMPASDVVIKAVFTTAPSGSYTVTVDKTISHGRIYASPTYGAPGASIRLTVVPDPLYQFEAGTLKYNGTPTSDPEKDESGKLTASLKIQNTNVSVSGEFVLISPPLP
jgi:hypothetical protein